MPYNTFKRLFAKNTLKNLVSMLAFNQNSTYLCIGNLTALDRWTSKAGDRERR